MARPTKSSSDLKAGGTFRPDRHSTRLENNTSGIKSLPAPAHYDKQHRAKWDEVVKHLAGFGILESQDFDSISLYVETIVFQRICWTEFQKTKQIVIEVETKAGTVSKINPAYTAYLKADTVLKPLREKFAFTPKDRQSVHVTKKDVKKADPMTAIMSQTAKTKVC